jgi:hypothetical protein
MFHELPMAHEEVLIAFSPPPPPPPQYLFINFSSRWLTLLLRDFTLIENYKLYSYYSGHDVFNFKVVFTGSHNVEPSSCHDLLLGLFNTFECRFRLLSLLFLVGFL